jgi:plasmid stabilization system protein ParE
MALSIKWNKRAVKQFDDAITYIENDSPTNAEKFRRDILHEIDRLLKHSENHSPDKYKINNDGTFRAFELHRYRVAYRIRNNEIRIIKIRHAKMNPLNY